MKLVRLRIRIIDAVKSDKMTSSENFGKNPVNCEAFMAHE